MWGQTTAGVVAGLPLSFLLAAVLAALMPISLHAKLAVTVVLALPLWIGVISAAFATAHGWRAWAGLLAANVACYLLLTGLKAAGWYGVPPGLLS